jgi:general secretion pathway protein D
MAAGGDPRELLPVPNPHARTNSIRVSAGRQAILHKLDSIRLDRVFYDGFSLSEVLRSLTDEVRKRDPDKRGVNFTIASPELAQAPWEAGLDSLTGSPKPARPAGAVDPASIVIALRYPLTNICLVDVLDAIMKVASQPLKYSIEDSAVVFSLKRHEAIPLYARTFKVDPNTLLENLHLAKGRGGTNGPVAVASALRDRLSKEGVDLDPVKNPGKAIFCNDRESMLVVRATRQDLDIIERKIAVLNTAPPQINIKCKFVEVSQDDTKPFGFGWYLGNMLMTNGAIGGQAGTAPTTIAPNSTNQLWTSGSRISSTSFFTSTGILTEPQFGVVIKALQQRSGTELLAQPEVTTTSGRQAQMKAVDVITVVTGINKRALTPSGIIVTNGEEGSLYVTEKMELGPVLDVIPSVLPDGYTIELMVIPTVTEFLGYEENPTNRVAVYVNGKKKWVIPPQPKFRVGQMCTNMRVRDGQTVVLGGLLSETVNTIKDQVPMLGSLPLVGNLFRSETKTIQKKNLLVFITPTLIDPAGNRVHSEEHVPFTREAVPPQPPR